MSHVLIVGAGHAGVGMAAAMRARDERVRVTIVGGEPELPYERPPLSKAVLLGTRSLDDVRLRNEAWFDKSRVDLLLDTWVRSIDREARTVGLDTGRTIAYDHLVLATGSRPRPLPVPGAHLRRVMHLVTAQHSLDLRDALAAASDVVIIGGGFVGLEVAAASSAAGKRTTVLEVADRVLARATGPTVSRHVADHHRSQGIDIRLARGVTELLGDGHRVAAVRTDDGVIPADLVLVGIGSTAAEELAAQAGLHCDSGIVVDELLRTGDPDISAIGDCCRFPHQGRMIRLESVQNAAEQGRTVAHRLAPDADQDPRHHDAVPWFWSDQGALRLQMVGLADSTDDEVTRGALDSNRFSVFRFRGEQLTAVESVNHAAGHMLGRRLLQSSHSPTRAQVADPATNLAALIHAAD